MKKYNFLLVLLVFSFNSFAFDKEKLTALKDSVKELCQNSSEKGSYKNVTVTGGGEVNVKFSRLIKAGLDGNITFSNGEWNGIQQVLKEHQADENKDYRICVRELTPKFLEKFQFESRVYNPIRDCAKGDKPACNKLMELSNQAKNYCERTNRSNPRHCGNMSIEVRGLVALAENIVEACGIMYENSGSACIGAKKTFLDNFPNKTLDSLEDFIAPVL